MDSNCEPIVVLACPVYWLINGVVLACAGWFIRYDRGVVKFCFFSTDLN